MCQSVFLLKLQPMFPIWQVINVGKKPCVFSLVMSNSRLRQWKVVQKSISKAPRFFHYPQSFVTFLALLKYTIAYPSFFKKQHWHFENLNIFLKLEFPNTFDKLARRLTCQKSLLKPFLPFVCRGIVSANIKVQCCPA